MYCLLTLAANAALLIVARRSAVFAEWYASRLFPLFPNTLGRLFSPLPFSVLEMLIALTAAGLPLFLLWSVVQAVRGQTTGGRKAVWPPLAAACCTLLLIYTLTCGINYSRAPLSAALGLEPRPYSARELRSLFTLLNEKAALAAEDIQTDARGYFILSEDPGEEGRMAMGRLGGEYGPLKAYYPLPKAVICSRALSYLHIAGVYSPFTVEANYNRDMPPTELPFSICHELAHLCGYAREDEANFIAYLACEGSGNPGLYYSGQLTALTYALNALYGEIPSGEYKELIDGLPAQVSRDMHRNAIYWQAFAGPAAELSRNVNDHYLKANDQPDGVKSYGRMLDLLLAYYF
ncbi:MAG: DUF3810 domain-containing protein [Clostridiales bacterium]|nr:DUF3810 domain-containing protein [Clostridiales bacterium]